MQINSHSEFEQAKLKGGTLLYSHTGVEYRVTKLEGMIFKVETGELKHYTTAIYPLGAHV